MRNRNPTDPAETVVRPIAQVRLKPIWAWLGGLALLSLIAVLAVLPHLVSPYVRSLVFLIFFYVALAGAWNLFSGYTGYVNFGYTALVGFGAYAFTVPIWKYGFHWLPAILSAGIFTAAFAFIIGVPLLLKTRGVYFAIAALGLSAAVRILFGTDLMRPLTNAGVGIGFISGMDRITQYYAMGILALLVIVISFLVITSRFGLQLITIREDELAAQVLGIPTAWKKILTFTLSGALAGIAGGIHAAYLSYIDPSSVFGIQYTIQPIVMALFGGLGTIFGPVLGAVLFTLISEIIWMKFFLLHLLIFGLVLIIIVLFLPQGIIPWLQDKRLLPRVRWL